MQYGQFCPIAKATEIIGEKWTILIIRELLMGSSRFNELLRGLTSISPTVLTKRLRTLEEYGLILKKRMQGKRGHQYFPTPACEELLPVIRSLGDWGMRWARMNLTESDYDVELLLLYLQRSIVPAKLPGNETVIRFKFTDIEDMSGWWILVQGKDVDVCVTDPGKDVDIYFTSTVRTMADIWMGDANYRQAISSGEMRVTGPSVLTRDISAWMSNSMFAGIPSAREI